MSLVWFGISIWYSGIGCAGRTGTGRGAGGKVVRVGGEVGGDWLLNGISKSNWSGEGKCLRLEGELGVCDIVGKFRVNDMTKQAMKHLLALGCVCQFRLETWEHTGHQLKHDTEHKMQTAKVKHKNMAQVDGRHRFVRLV